MTNTQAAAWLRDALREDHDMREYTGKALMSDHRRSVYLTCLRALQGPQQDGNKAYINDHHKQEHALQERALGRIDTPPGFDSVRTPTGFQRDGGDKTERRCRSRPAEGCEHCAWIDTSRQHEDEDGPINYCRVCGRDLRR